VVTDLTSLCDKSIFTKKDVYHRSQTKHWDGYKSEEIICMDDVFQDHGSTPQDSTLMEYLFLVSNGVYMLPMASVEEKGTAFSGKFLITNTNNPFPNGNEVTTIGAIHRRRNMLIEVKRKPGGSLLDPNGRSYTLWHSEKVDNVAKSKRYFDSYEEMMAYMVVDFDSWFKTGRDLKELQEPDYDKINQLIEGRTQMWMPSFLRSNEVVSYDVGNVAGIIDESDAETVPDFMSSEMAKTIAKIVAFVAVATTAITVVTSVLGKKSDHEEDDEDFVADERRDVQSRVGELLKDVKFEGNRKEATDSIMSYLGEGRKETMASGDATTNRARRSATVRTGGITFGRTQGAMTDIIECVVDSNIVMIGKPKEDKTGMRYLLNGIGVCGRYLLVPTHFPYRGEIGMIRAINGLNKLFTFNWYDCEVNYFSVNESNGPGYSYDMALLKLPLCIPEFRDIRRHFQTNKEMSDNQGKTKSVLVRRTPKGVKEVALKVSSLVRTCFVGCGLDVEGKPVKTLLLRAYAYAGLTVPGDSGAVLFAERQGRAKIIGIHVGGGDDLAWSSPFSREMINEIVDAVTGEYENVGMDVLNVVLSDSKIRTPIFKGLDIKHVGNVAPELKMRIPRTTDIHPSLLHGVFGAPLTGPAVMSLDDPRVKEGITKSPLQQGLEKFINDVEVPEEFLEIGVEEVAGHMYEMSGTRSILTDDQVLNGVKNGGVDRIDPETSPGLPYKWMRPNGVTGKRFLFDISDDSGETIFRFSDAKIEGLAPKTVKALEGIGMTKKMIDHPTTLLQERYRLLDEMLQNGDSIEDYVIGYENLKQERRKIEKIEQAKTRTFDCLPLDFNLLLRKYFGSWAGACHMNCNEFPISVGMDPLGIGWTKLYQRMDTFGSDRIIAGDYAGWDGMVTETMMMAAIQAINEWYDDPYGGVRILLAKALIHTNLLVGDTIYRKNKGLPSGCAITAELNSLINWILLVSCFYAIEPDAPFDYRQCMVMALYGDDHLVGASDLYENFNFQTLSALLRTMGIKYTDTKKSLVSTFEFEDLHEVTYLKRKFSPWKNGFIRAPLQDDVLTEMVMWMRGKDQIAAQRDILNSFSAEIGQKERDFYDTHVEGISNGLKELRDNNAIEPNDIPYVRKKYGRAVDSWVRKMQGHESDIEEE